MRLEIRGLTADAFAPYGTVIGRPETDAEASGTGWKWWSEAAMIPAADRPYAVGYLTLEPMPLAFDWAEYHLQSQEVIIPLGHDCLVYVGAVAEEPDWDRFSVFRLRPGQVVMVREGVWHGAPLALDHPLSAIVLLRQGTGQGDVYKAERPDGPIHIDYGHE